MKMKEYIRYMSLAGIILCTIAAIFAMAYENWGLFIGLFICIIFNVINIMHIEDENR
jgi:hypothetical protein